MLMPDLGCNRYGPCSDILSIDSSSLPWCYCTNYHLNVHIDLREVLSAELLSSSRHETFNFNVGQRGSELTGGQIDMGSWTMHLEILPINPHAE